MPRPSCVQSIVTMTMMTSFLSHLPHFWTPFLLSLPLHPISKLLFICRRPDDDDDRLRAPIVVVVTILLPRAGSPFGARVVCPQDIPSPRPSPGPPGPLPSLPPHFPVCERRDSPTRRSSAGNNQVECVIRMLSIRHYRKSLKGSSQVV